MEFQQYNILLLPQKCTLLPIIVLGSLSQTPPPFTIQVHSKINSAGQFSDYVDFGHFLFHYYAA